MKLKHCALIALTATALIGCKDDSSDDKPPKESVLEILTALNNNHFTELRVIHDYNYPLDLDDYDTRNGHDGDRHFCYPLDENDEENGITTNVALCALDPSDPPTQGVLSRYKAEGDDLIQIFFNDPDGVDKPIPDAIFEAIAHIEDVVGRPMFKDVDTEGKYMTKVSIPEESFPWPTNHDNRYSDAENTHGVRGGIVIGTGLVVDKGEGRNCGNWAATPQGNSGYHLVNGNNEFTTDEGFGWIRLPDENDKCQAPKLLVVHEIAHALGWVWFGDSFEQPDGLTFHDSQHFRGFGWDGVWSDHADDVLYAHYNIPIGTKTEDLEAAIKALPPRK
ncbi:hypothetical protein AB4209_20970 [Vibrio sp. 10N.286.48.C11]|uniref:hypothetical protein n=1 Tax=Vibrio sp. 10N.286.48.C11 TaxID=3229698 RepID=UPI003552A0A4